MVLLNDLPRAHQEPTCDPVQVDASVSSDLPSDLPTEAMDIEDNNIMVYSTNIFTNILNDNFII